MFVDSHCHLSFPELHAQLDRIRVEMAEAKVDRALAICTTLEEFDRVHAIALAHDNLWASVGVHPDEEGVAEPSLDDLVGRAALPRVVAIGETGLDYYRLGGRSVEQMQWQRERYRVHIRASRASGKPLVIHTRAAPTDTIRLLRDERGSVADGAPGGVFHCFTETMEVARAALDLGYSISFSGILTFRNAGELRDVARYVPLESCLIETDSPYLAPVPFRGKTNTPALVPWVARQLADIKSLSVEAVAEATSRNFERLFGLERPASAG